MVNFSEAMKVAKVLDFMMEGGISIKIIRRTKEYRIFRDYLIKRDKHYAFNKNHNNKFKEIAM